VHTVTITTGQTATVYVQDVPQYDPVAILLRKVDAATGQSVAQGDTSLANAEFKVTTSKGDVVGKGNGIFKTDET